MTDELHIDYETRSPLDLTDVGAYVYFDSPNTDVWCAALSFNDEEPFIWHPGEPLPPRVAEHIESGGVLTAWNAAFERLASRCILTPRYGWPSIEDEQWRCTMTEALGMNFPGKLERAAPAFGLNITKDEKGSRLMKQMMRPRKPRKGEDTSVLYWWDDADRRARLDAYCLQDVRVETAIGRKVLRLRPQEQKLYFLDMKINERGVYIDAKLCHAASRIVEKATDRIDSELKRVTQNAINSVNQHVPLKNWLNERGVGTDSVDKESVEDLLILDIPDDCRRALELRQEGSKTSTAKIQSMLARRQADGRMRGNLQFYGASSTGRWAARGAQLQNLTHPVILKEVEGGASLDDQIKLAIEYIEMGSPLAIELAYGPPMTLVSDCIRPMIKAPSGKILRVSDFSNIEGRCIPWHAGQEDKLEAFRAFDRGEGPDLYLVAAAGIYNLPISEVKQYRATGKVGELSLGFQGGPRALAKMAKKYKVNLEAIHPVLWEIADFDLREKVREAWEERGRKTGMTEKAWMAGELVKLGWRRKNWKIEEFWHDVEDAAINAVRHEGEAFPVGRVIYKKVGSALFCKLPSGRALCYAYPRLKEAEMPWGGTKTQLRYKRTHPITHQWVEHAAYGGLFAENITQATARDVMAEAMLRVEDAGYELILTVHDELIAENDVDFGSLDEYNQLMTIIPDWAEGFPITAGGWEGYRYKKG